MLKQATNPRTEHFRLIFVACNERVQATTIIEATDILDALEQCDRIAEQRALRGLKGTYTLTDGNGTPVASLEKEGLTQKG